MPDKTQHSPGEKSLVVVEKNKIVAVVPVSSESHRKAGSTGELGLQTGVSALPGQQIYELELPKEFTQLKTAVEKHKWLERHRFEIEPHPHLKPLT